MTRLPAATASVQLTEPLCDRLGAVLVTSPASQAGNPEAMGPCIASVAVASRCVVPCSPWPPPCRF